MVHVGEVTHAGGKVDGSSTISHFDFAPRTVRVKEDESIGSAALIFVVVALRQAFFGRTGWRISPMNWVGSHQSRSLHARAVIAFVT